MTRPVMRFAGTAGGSILRSLGVVFAVVFLCTIQGRADTTLDEGAGGSTSEAAIALPSGGQVSLQEIITDYSVSGLILRFRFVQDRFDPARIDQDALSEDLLHLCDALAVPHVASTGISPGQIVISLADQPSEFAVADPNIRQVFEAFTIRDDRCIWEMF
ncbi:DUF6497 family protein [Roseovarius aestuarii]|nr:DUF6497 family protein [Roseovarius aestuarii]